MTAAGKHTGVHLLNPVNCSMNVNHMAIHSEVALAWLPFLKYLQWLAGQDLVLTPVSFVKIHPVRINQEVNFSLFLNITYDI